MTLVEITREIRIILKLLVISLGAALCLFLLFQGIIFVKNVFFPTPLPPPEEKFGNLPQVLFPRKSGQELSYKIDTITGKLPSFSDRAKVYKIHKREPNLVALDTARRRLRNLGFDKNESKISNSIYQWGSDSGEAIILNIFTGTFRIHSGYLTSPPQSFNPNSVIKESLIRIVTDFLGGLGESVEDIDFNTSPLSYLRITNGIVEKANSLSEAQLVRFDLLQKDIDKLKIYYPDLNQSTIYFIFKAEDSYPKIVEARFLHLAPDAQSSTYPIKTAEQAFNDLRTGKGLVFNQNAKSATIHITDVNLGYYIGEENQEFLVPIVVFTGKNFTGYVQAIAD